MTPIELTRTVPEGFAWLNPPQDVGYEPGQIRVTTDPETDFWQRTHYGFRRDNGHCLLREVAGDFSFQARFEFEYRNRYDQCGLMLRHDAENWIKVSIELEEGELARLGSVATNLGFSDWATTDIPASTHAMSYRVSRTGDDVLSEWSEDGRSWRQMRVCHLHAVPASLRIGVYAASPMKGRFSCRIVEMAMGAGLHPTETAIAPGP